MLYMAAGYEMAVFAIYLRRNTAFDKRIIDGYDEPPDGKYV